MILITILPPSIINISLLECRFGDVYQTFLQQSVLQGEEGKTFAQMHLFLEFLEDFGVEVVGVGEETVESSHDGVQTFSFADGNPT